MLVESNGQRSFSEAAGSDCIRAAELLIYNHQRRRIEKTYEDFSGYTELRDYFFGLLYPPPDARARFSARNRTYSRIARSPILRLILHPDSIRIMNQVYALEKEVDALNRRVAEAMCSRGPLPAELDEEAYFALCRETSGQNDHERQFDYAYEAFYFGEAVVKYIPMNLEQILNLVPKMLIRNSDLLDLAAGTYHTFHGHKDRLEEFRLALHYRELDYIGRMFGVKIDRKPFVKYE